MSSAVDYAAVFEEHRPFLWALSYRMTGTAADADDVVQETFVRAMEKPPADTGRPWRPWLVRVATNLARDLLRRRRRRGYIGPWLPSPIETDENPPAFEPVFEGLSTEGRYDLLESVTFAFLLALEALTPLQRAILLLRDVFDYSVEETAEALGTTAGGIRTGHHRARRAMQAYDQDRCRPTRELAEETRAVLEKLVGSVATGDVAAIESLLAADCRALSDGGGEFLAARNPILGANRVARFFVGIGSGRAANVTVRTLNGLPAVVVDLIDPPPRIARRTVIQIVLDAAGRAKEIHTVLARRKLTALGPDRGAARG